MKVKTVVIVNDFNYTQGGASKVAIDTAKILKDENLDVYFFSAVNKEEENIDGIKYIFTNQNEALKEKNRLKGCINGVYNFKAKRIFKNLLENLDRETTVIHVHGWTKALSSSIFDIAFKMNFKVVVTLHDYFTACPNGGYFNYKENKICEKKPLSGKCIKCNCDSRNYGFKVYRLIRQYVQNKIVKLNDKLKYAIGISDLSICILKTTLNAGITIKKIYNPIEYGEDKKVIDASKNEYYLYVGRISKEKGVDLFCRAITELGLKGIVVGDGSERERLEMQFPHIEFTGWKNKEDVTKYMMGARALIFPSLWYETAGLTILEAQALGVPCIVSEWCAGKEFIKESINGFTFNSYDDLKLKIKQVNNIEKCLDNLKKYNYDYYKNNLIRYYELFE